MRDTMVTYTISGYEPKRLARLSVQCQLLRSVFATKQQFGPVFGMGVSELLDMR